MPRPQVTLRALLVAMLVVAAFFGGQRAGSTGNPLLAFLLTSLAGALLGMCIASAKDWPWEAGILLGAIFVWPILAILAIWSYLVFG